LRKWKRPEWKWVSKQILGHLLKTVLRFSKKINMGIKRRRIYAELKFVKIFYKLATEEVIGQNLLELEIKVERKNFSINL